MHVRVPLLLQLAQPSVPAVEPPRTPGADELRRTAQRMPGLSGFELCSRVRSLWPGTKLPIILLSACSDAEDVATGLKLGCNDYVKKVIIGSRNPLILNSRSTALCDAPSSWRQN